MLHAQNENQPAERDTANMQSLSDLNLEVEPIDSVKGRSVKAATLWALLPGAGQLYNRKYWKVPIVYAGLGTAIYFAYDNHQTYSTFINSFLARTRDSVFTDIYVGIYTERQLVELQDVFRRYRDLSIILAVVGYGLQILDAHVDAHLYYYDISDDLALHWQPSTINTFGSPPALGAKISLYF